MSLIKIDDHALLKIDGNSAEKLLQGQLTCDVAPITATRSTLGAHCNAKGRIESFFRLFRRQDSFYLIMPNTVIEAAYNHIKKYAQFFRDVSLSIESIPCYGLIHPEKAEFPLPSTTNEVTHTDDLSICRVSSNDRYFIIDWTGTLTAPVDNQQWHQAEIKDNIPRLYPETLGEFLPHYLNLPEQGAVSFTKGCYIGQEIIARMEHRGNIKQGLFLHHSTTALNPGQHITLENGLTAQCVDCVAIDGGYQALVIHEK